MIVWLKFLHLAAISLWCAGLICLPGLYVKRARVRDDEELYRLQGMVRFCYVALVSPAAFVAVGSGTALVFIADTFVPWFSLKLLLVGGLVFLHIVTGLVIIRLFEDGEGYPSWRFLSVTVATLALTVAILAVVLGKPEFSFDFLPGWLSEPGALRDIFNDLTAWAK